MDRIISLLAAFVGLIALGGAVLFFTRADTEQQRLAAEIAALRSNLAAISQQPAAASPVSAPAQSDAAGDGTAEALLALQTRIATLEETARVQADALATAQAELAARPAGDATQVAIAQPQSATPAALDPGGPTTECVPLGTRFMGQAGDTLPICKTRAVVRVAAVSEGEAILEGIGSVPAGGVQALEIAGCTVTVFSADSSGYAEMRVTCT